MLKYSTVHHNPFEDSEFEKVIPTNGPQQEIWLSCILGDEPASLSYNEAVSLHLKGNLNVDAFKKAVQMLIDRHEALRSVLSKNGESIWVQKTVSAKLPIVDIVGETAEKQQQIIKDYTNGEVNIPFDLYKGPLFRMALHILGKGQYQFTITIHHIIADGWSMGVLMEDLSKLYNTLVCPDKNIPIGVPGQLSQYAFHHIAYRETAHYKKIQAYWHAKLHRVDPDQNLPTDFVRPESRSYRGKRLDFALPADVYKSLYQLASRVPISVTFAALCAFEIFLRKYMQQMPTIVGLPTAGQLEMENPDLMGHCVHFLPILSHERPDETFFDYLSRRKKELSADLTHKSITFSEILKTLATPRRKNQVPFVPIVFNMDVGMNEGIEFLDLEHTLISHPRSYENFDLFLNWSGNSENMVCEWSYNTDIFQEATIIDYHLYFLHTLRELTKDPDQIRMHPERRDVVALLEASVNKHSTRLALIFQDEALTYAELNHKVNQLAAYFLMHPVNPGDQIGITTDRSIDMLITMLAIVKIGAVFVPIDGKFPKQRKRLLLDNLNLLFVVSTRTDQHDTTGEYGYLKEYAADVLLAKAKALPTHNPAVPCLFERPVYILHTSGSTGLPKGVRMNQPALSNLFQWQIKHSQADKSTNTLQFSPLNFDVSFQEIFSTLFTGGTLVLIDDDTRLDPSKLLPYLIQHQIHRLFMPFVALQSLAEVADTQNVFPPALKEVFTAGEQLKITPQITRFFSNIPQAILYNHYGPTETHIVTSLKLTGEATQWPALPSIGHEIDHTEAFILDDQLHLLPDGEIGELCISGICLADGYENQEEQTARRFPTWMHPDGRTIRIYKSGDLAKRLPNGHIQFLGRLDDQVKIRGFRVELSEIEYYLNQENGVKQSVVVAKTNPKLYNTWLTAFITLDQQRLTAKNPAVAETIDWKQRWDHLYKSADKAQRQHAGEDLDTLVFKQLGTFEDAEKHAQEWLDQTLLRIRETWWRHFGKRPITILEIGCGGGQLLQALAPECTHYFASDYAEIAIQNLREHLPLQPEKHNRITLSVSEANNLTFLNGQKVDMIILNSVIQYFSDETYLLNVLDNAMQHLAPNGCLYVGDVQALETLEMCIMGEQLRHVKDNMDVHRFRTSVQQRVATEDELVVDPIFFDRLPEHLSSVSHVDIQLKRGLFLNETTKYHYDVWLYQDVTMHTVEPKHTIAWEQLGSLNELNTVLTRHPSETFLIENIPNRRCDFDYHFAQRIRSAANHRTLADIKAEVSACIVPGQDPEAFWQLGDALNFDTYVRWCTTGADNQMMVAFIPKALEGKWHFKKNPVPNTVDPIFESKAIKIIDSPAIEMETRQWKEKLKERLPEYMVPDRMVVISHFPLTSTGKIDRKALASLDVSVVPHAHTKPAETDTERFLQKLWQKLLSINPIGTDQDFFELGGHSLLAIKVMVAIEKEYAVQLPLAILFDHSTIQQLAQQIVSRMQTSRATENHHPWNALVPIRVSGSKSPLYLVHGAGLNVLMFKSFVRYLDPNQPVYGIQALGQNGKMDLYEDIHQIAAQYNADLLKNDPNGPYLIGGYSYGGFLAFEMARQLKAMGKTVGMLAIFDTYVGEIGHKGISIKRWLKKAGFAATLLFKHPLRYPLHCLFLLKLKIRFLFSKQHIDQVETFVHEKKIVHAYREAFHRYSMEPQAIDITLFKANHSMQYYEEPHFMGWKQYADQVTVYPIPGEHKTIFYPPNDQGLAKALMQAIQDKNQE